MIFVIYRNINDYLSVVFEGYRPHNENYKVVLDRKYDGLIGKINSAHNSISVNSKINLPLKRMWYNKSTDFELINEYYIRGEEIVFLFFEGNRLAYQEEYLHFLKQKYPKAKFAFRFINIIDKDNLQVLMFVKKQYDIIVSMDREDCNSFDLIYCPNTFWIDNSRIPIKKQSDFFFVGANKNRVELLGDIYNTLSDKGYRCLFFLSRLGSNDTSVFPPGIIETSGINYLDYLGYINSTNCVLELVSDNQKGSTLRAIEAAYFKKTLITNNEAIKEEDYFDPNSTIIISNINDLKGDFRIKDLKRTNKADVDHERLLDRIFEVG